MRKVTIIVFLICFGSVRSEDSYTWIRTGGPPGGLGYDIRYNFDNPDIWYVTDNYAGVHMSTDNGMTWHPANTGIPPQAGPTGDAIPIFSLTVDPNNPQILWAGTNPTGRIYRSQDGGQSWERRDNGITIDYDGGLTFRGFTVDPSTSDIVYAMGETSDPLIGFAVWGPGTGGVVFKTTDGGENWQKIWDGGMPSSLCRYMWIDPRDTDVLYVSTGIFDRGAIGDGNPDTDPDPFGGIGILKSTDGGETWDILDADNGLYSLYIGSLYMHPEDPDILLAGAGHLAPGAAVDYMIQNQYSPNGIYRTSDGGETWTQVLMPNDNWGECFTSVEFYTGDPNIAYAGSASAVYRSEDAGLKWTRVSGGIGGWGPPGITAGWPIDMQCDPRDPNRIFANNYNGGNFLSEDGGKTWKNASSGYTGSQMRRAEVDPFNAARVYATGRSGIWRSDDAGAQWHGIFFPPKGDDSVPGLEWLSISADPHQPDHILASLNVIMESDDGGLSWDIRLSLNEILDELPESSRSSAVTVFSFAPSDQNIVYANLCEGGLSIGHERAEFVWQQPGGGVLISQDGGTTWQRAVDKNIQYASIPDIAVDPSDAKTVYAACYKGIYKSTDAGENWTLLPGLPEDVLVRAVAVNPNNKQHLLAGLEGVGIYYSLDGGQTWEIGYAGLESNGSLHDIIFDPIDPEIAYTSDYYSGVYRSENGGKSWNKINSGLRNRTCLGLSISSDGQHLYVATGGEGVFRLDVNGEVPVHVAKNPDHPAVFLLTPNYPNPFNTQTTIHFTLSNPAQVRADIFNIHGEKIDNLMNQIKSAGYHQVVWDASKYPSGTYLIRVQAGKSIQYQKWLLLK